MVRVHEHDFLMWCASWIYGPRTCVLSLPHCPLVAARAWHHSVQRQRALDAVRCPMPPLAPFGADPGKTTAAINREQPCLDGEGGPWQSTKQGSPVHLTCRVQVPSLAVSAAGSWQTPDSA